ncbi:hypothetical protein BDW02DRAFT_566717 [Decorospora gaudefroyi]|uniref:N-alpha-acetyltransferase 40 n=1 Tax=Decorospora gaudefroyi TaxID=184978 RepID=A0A6A5KLZ4_9PLEO|nr:hypothetical protein BDW02DRAFT_566717 [Decorospora gaudefroyi]
MVSQRRRDRVAEIQKQLKDGIKPHAVTLRGGDVVDDLFRTPIYINYDLDVEMPPHVARAQKVQKVLWDDVSGLRACETPQPKCPLKFGFVPSGNKLKKAEFDACIGLVERTSSKDYRASGIGWNPRKKREEMLDAEMMYLLVRQGDAPAVAERNLADEDVGAGNITMDKKKTMEDPPITGQDALAQQNIADIEEEKSYTHVQEPPKLNALTQLIQAYASDSEEEESGEKESSEEESSDEESDETDSDETDNKENDSVKPYPPRPSKVFQAVKKKFSLPDPCANGPILGFISFMYTYDDAPHEDREVVYIYEIHLHEHLRGQGLGSKLIEFVEDAARECQVNKTMLTVFMANERAIRMYKRLGYGKDESSPEDKVMRHKAVKAQYLIMSKVLD